MRKVYVNDAKFFCEAYQPVADAVKKGKLTHGLAKSVGVTRVPIASNNTGITLAQNAVRQIDFPPDDGSEASFYYSYVRHPQWELWPTWAYVAQNIPFSNLSVSGVTQMSSGGMKALIHGISDIRTRGGFSIVSTGDSFEGRGFDRWHSDPGTFFGDAGTAALLSEEPYGLEILSFSEKSDLSLEGLYHPCGSPCSEFITQVDSGEALRNFLRTVPYQTLTDRMKITLRSAFDNCLKGTNFSSRDIDLYILPNIGIRKAGFIFESLDIRPKDTLWGEGVTVGHLGAGDHIWSLTHLLFNPSLKHVRNFALVGIGAGFSASVIVGRKV